MPDNAPLFRSLSLVGVAALLSACMGSQAAPPEPVAIPAPQAEAAAPETVEDLPPPPPDPARLDGLTPGQVIALMGEPALVRRDGKVQVMLFETTGCVYEIVFIEPDLNSHFEVRHHSARTRRGADADPEACLSQILPGGTWPE